MPDSPKATAAEPTVQQLFDLTGKRALITGSTGHLGSAMARALAEAGASVVATSRSLEHAQAVAAGLPSPTGARHVGIDLDQMQSEQLEARFAAAVDAAGPI